MCIDIPIWVVRNSSGFVQRLALSIKREEELFGVPMYYLLFPPLNGNKMKQM